MYTVGRPVIMRPNGGGVYILSIYTQHVCANGPAFSSRQTLVSTLPSQEPSTKKKLNSHTPAMKRSLIDNILPPLFLLERKRFHSSSVFHSVLGGKTFLPKIIYCHRATYVTSPKCFHFYIHMGELFVMRILHVRGPKCWNGIPS